MRVLYIMPAEAFGGAERQGVVHIANLPKTGTEVVAVTGPGQPICRELDRAGVRGYLCSTDFPDLELETPGFWASLARPWRYLRSWGRTTRSLLALARREKVDVIFASRTFGWFVGSIVGRVLGIPVIWRAGSFPSSQAQIWALRHLAPLVAPSALVANSEAGRRFYAGFFHVPTAVLPNGVDTRRFDPERAQPRIRRELGLQDVPVIGLAARPAPEKGLDYLAEVTRHLCARHPETRVLVAGDFPWRSRYQQMFAELGLGSRVTFLGHVADIESFYASVDVAVLTSRRGSIEMSSNAVLEAMATGRPVVVTDVGAMAELVEDGRSGFVVPDDAPDRFAHRVLSLIDDPSLRQRLGSAAHLQVLRSHSEQAVTETLASILLAVRGLAPAPHQMIQLAPAGKEAA